MVALNWILKVASLIKLSANRQVTHQRLFSLTVFGTWQVKMRPWLDYFQNMKALTLRRFISSVWTLIWVTTGAVQLIFQNNRPLKSSLSINQNFILSLLWTVAPDKTSFMSQNPFHFLSLNKNCETLQLCFSSERYWEVFNKWLLSWLLFGRAIIPSCQIGPIPLGIQISGKLCLTQPT